MINLIMTAHQPAYMPWLGYFEKISKSDVYVYLDDVQFEKRSFINRNKIKSPNGEVWLTVPVYTKGHRNKVIKDIKINNEILWKKDHLETIYYNYKRAQLFDENYPKLQKLYEKEYLTITELCFEQLMFWLDEFNITTQIIKQSQINTINKKDKLILELCEKTKCNKYISGLLGKDYLKEENFIKRNIQLEFQNFEHPIYKQQWGDFTPNLSIIDYWMNVGNDYFERGKER